MSPGNDAETARLRGQRWAVLAARPRAQAPVAEGVAPGLREIARPESCQEHDRRRCLEVTSAAAHHQPL